MMRSVLAIVVLLLAAIVDHAEASRGQVASSLRVHTSSHSRSHTRRHARAHSHLNQHADGVSNATDNATDSADDDDDNDADDDDDDDATQSAAASKAAELHKAEVHEARDALADVKWKKNTNKQQLDNFKDVSAFKKELAIEVKTIANETQAPGLANFLGEIRDDLRTYAEPTYSKHLEDEQSQLEAKQNALEAKLAALENKSSAVEHAAEHKEETPAAKAPKAVTKDVSKALEADEAEIKELKEKVEKRQTNAGHVFAFAFLGTVTMLSLVFALANSRGMARNYTWFLMDQVTAVFLAVMYFQAFDDLLDFFDIGGHHKVLAAVLHSLIMLTMALVLATMLKGHEVGLAVLCGAGAHVVSFTSIHAAATVQNNVWLKVGHLWAWCLCGLIVLALVLGAIGAVIYRAKRARELDKDDGFMDKTDDLENDFGAMAFSVCFTMFVRFLLTGHHPVDDDTDFDHGATDRNLMLVYAILALIVACFAVPFLSSRKIPDDAYFLKRVINFFTTVIAMNVAWAFFYWAEWELFETVFAGQPIFGRIAFALSTSVLACILIPVLCRVRGMGAKTKKLALTVVSLMVAWSWELCFDASIDDMCEGRDHPAMYKMGATVFMFIVVIPVYAGYMKPISMPAAEDIGA